MSMAGEIWNFPHQIYSEQVVSDLAWQRQRECLLDSDISLRHEFVTLSINSNIYCPLPPPQCKNVCSWKKMCNPLSLSLKNFILWFSKFWSIELKTNGTRWYSPVSYLKMHNTIIIILSNSLKPLKIEGCIIQIGKVTYKNLVLSFSEFLKASNMSKNNKIIFEPTGNFQ